MMDWAIGTGIAVSLLIVLVLIIRRPFAKMFGARAAYALWLLPFIRLVMPEITIPRIFPRLVNSTLSETALSSDIVVTPEMMAALQAEPSFISQLESYAAPTIFGIWAIGAAIFFLYHWIRQASLMDRLIYTSEPALQLRRDITSAAYVTGLKRLPQVRISDEKVGPLVAGFWDPIVILPDNFLTAFNPQQRHYALMHEFMHIKRGDVWVALAWLGFRAVNWPNPLVHYAARHFRSDQEAACDASVLSAMGDTKDVTAGYAETLIHAAKAAISDGRASPAPSQLTLTIHHPLKERLMILGTHRKTSNWRSRIAAAVMIIGAACISAPLIQADAHPEAEVSDGELAGKYNQHQGKSVIKRKVKVDGKTVSEHFEIHVNDDKIEAFKIGPLGKKIPINLGDIGGVDAADILSETFEGHDDEAHVNSRTIIMSDDDRTQVMSREAFKKWAEKEYPEWKEDDFASWVDGDYKEWVGKMKEGKLAFHNENGKRFEFHNFPHPPKPPGFSRFFKHSDNVIVLDSDDFPELKSLKKLESLKGLKGLEKLEALKSLKSLEGLEKLESLKDLENMDGFETFTFFSDNEDKLKLKMRLTESKLAAARAMLEDTEVDQGDSREMAKAKRELEKARKALKAAEKALKEAE